MGRKLFLLLLDFLVAIFSIEHPFFAPVVKLFYYILCWLFGVEPEKF